MSLHAGHEKEISQVKIIIAKVTLERAPGRVFLRNLNP